MRERSFLPGRCDPITDTGTIRLEGNERMHQRPISDLVDCLEGCGAGVTCVRSNGCLPVDIKTGRGLPGGTLRLSGGFRRRRTKFLLTFVVQLGSAANLYRRSC